MKGEHATARSGSFQRIARFLAVLYPPIPMFFGTMIVAGGNYLTLEAMASRAKLAYTWHLLAAGVTCFLLTLLLRVYDEIKDVDTDRRLAAAGDPKYVIRPIVTGAIEVGDLITLRRAVTVAVVAINVPLGAVTFGAFVGLFAVAWASSRWYFWPPMRERLLVAFVTHNPLTLLMNAYVAVVFAADFGWSSLSLWPTLATLGARQAIMSAWEISRKIRAPEDETDYVTYSRVLGWKVAPVVAIVAVIIAAGCMVWTAALADVSVVYTIVASAAALVPVVALVRFRLAPSARTSKLERPVEIFAGVISVALVAALVARWGCDLAPHASQSGL